MSKSKPSYNFLPALLVGLIEGVIIMLALACFFTGSGMSASKIYLSLGAALVFVSVLLGLGAYYTRKDELEQHEGESKILKIYQTLDIDENLRQAMVTDSVAEAQLWEQEWKEGSNATGDLSPKVYGLSILGGFLLGGLATILNCYFFELPDYAGLFFPFILLGVLGFYKYKFSNQKPLSGFLIISLSGMAAAFAAYYAGGLF
ncbi:VIT1/CCC1 transporter family protein [Niabella insulamsoli]|uniref:VIT1/CCC1 transporter family protein n=1 Tax=Niabella insulamsoli TaxID=3144874 RepID=UPI0031FCC169